MSLIPKCSGCGWSYDNCHCLIPADERVAAAPAPQAERAKLPIDRPCSACSSGDTKMEYHDHAAPFREVGAAPAETAERVAQSQGSGDGKLTRMIQDEQTRRETAAGEMTAEQLIKKRDAISTKARGGR